MLDRIKWEDRMSTKEQVGGNYQTLQPYLRSLLLD